MAFQMLRTSVVSTGTLAPPFWLEDIYIKAEYRGLGIGSQFIDYITKKYPDALLRLEVEEENARAVHVYKKSGFEFFEYKEMKKE